MDIFDVINPAWIQAGELGLAFVVVMLSAGLVIFVVKSSAHREQEYLRIITTVLPTLQGIATGMANINLRLESIEENQMREWDHKAPNKHPLKRSKQIAEVEKSVDESLEKIKAGALPEVPDAKVDK